VIYSYIQCLKIITSIKKCNILSEINYKALFYINLQLTAVTIFYLFQKWCWLKMIMFHTEMFQLGQTYKILAWTKVGNFSFLLVK